MLSNILADLLASAVVLEERDALRVVRRLQGVTAVAAITLVARWLGEAHALLGDRVQARADYERALAWATTVHHRPEIALARLAMAELLLEDESQVSGAKSQVGERATGPGTWDLGPGTALAHLDFAIEELGAMKMQPALERALRHKGLLHA